MATAGSKKAPTTAAKKKRTSTPEKIGAAKSLSKPPPYDDSAVQTALLEEKKAAEKAARKTWEENCLITYEISKVIVPMWFCVDPIDKAFRKNRSLPPEAALCLMLVGSGTNGEECEVGLQRRLRPSGLDRQDAQLVAMKGTASLIAAKLAERKPGKKYERLEDALAPIVLTAKGQKLYELVKGTIVPPESKSTAL